MSRYWIGVACRDHVQAAVAGGFAQPGHGKKTVVQRLAQGDWIIYYSSRTEMRARDWVQASTSIGRVMSKQPYHVTITPDFEPFRVDVDYVEQAHTACVRALIEQLELTRGLGSRWGMAFRRSPIEISPADFQRIARAMGVERQA